MTIWYQTHKNNLV